MNPSWELYRTGGLMVTRTLYLKRSRRVVVVDRAKKTRAAVLLLSARGHSPREIGRILGKPSGIVVSILQ